jgi:acetylornithine deacetylase/succinyl-diaminopimelate desuccinylase-like protein
VDELTEFLRFRSISSQAERTRDVAQCAQWLAAHLRRIGLKHVQVAPTGGNPVVTGAWLQATNRPTILVYGHYDVVSPEPLAKWNHDPFDPVMRVGALFARGANDDKGQLFCHLKAIESILASEGELPVNVKCLFEGEEEIGSKNLARFIEGNAKALRSDVVVISDTTMISREKPAISYAQRGGLRAEIVVCGPKRELHSGTFGGAVHNPIQSLCEIIAALHDRHGRIAIPGFYEGVRKWGDEERAFMRSSGPCDEAIRRDAGMERMWGERGFSVAERTTIRPALVLNGIAGGGVKGHEAVIPSCARARLSFRLVPDQDPQRIANLMKEHIERIAPPTVKVRVRAESPVRPALMDRRHPAMRSAALAYRGEFGAFPAFVRSGGSIPVVDTVYRILGVPAVLMGFGLPDDQRHAPNEKFDLTVMAKAIGTCIRYLFLSAGPHRRDVYARGGGNFF